MMTSLTRFCAVMAVLAVVSAEGSLRGAEVSKVEESPFFDSSCELGWTTADSCDDVVDANGDPCIWCALPIAGLCVDKTQASILGAYFDCGGSDKEDDDVLVYDDEDEDGVATKLSGGSDISTACLLAGTDADSCGSAVDDDGVTCIWCEVRNHDFALCLTSGQADYASKVLDCQIGVEQVPQVEEQDEEKGVLAFVPQDFSCAKSSGDVDACWATKDTKGNACSFCYVWNNYQHSIGVCVNDEQASQLEQVLECSTEGDDDDLAVPLKDDPFDFSCAQAATDEESCASADDADGDACVWCDYQGMVGICVNDAQATFLEKYMECGHDFVAQPPIVKEDPLDFTCEKTGTDQDSCAAAVDSEGDACVWCDYQGVVGLCVNDAQASLLDKYLECGDRHEEERAQMDDVEEDPFDFSCAKTATDEDSCGSAVDADGDKCVWCDYEGVVGLCVNDAQASIIDKYFDCGDQQEKEEIKEDPLDFTCEKAATDEDSCVSAVDADGDKCVWCDYEGMVGLCVDDAQASLIDKYLDCGDRTRMEDMKDSPFDLSCEKAGADEDSCSSAKDGDGDSCVWCDYQGMAGLCVDDTQASILENYMDCNASVEERKIDTTCLAGSRSEESCVATSDENGESCVWCTAFENYSLCVSAEQAKDVDKFASCTTSVHVVGSKEE